MQAWALAQRRRQATKHEGAREQLEGLAAALIDVLPDLVLRVGCDGVIRDCRLGRSSELAGVLDSASLIGKTTDDVLPAMASEVVRAAIDRAITTGEVVTQQWETAATDAPEGGRSHREGRFSKCAWDEVLVLTHDATAEISRRDTERFVHEMGRNLLSTSSVAHDAAIGEVLRRTVEFVGGRGAIVVVPDASSPQRFSVAHLWSVVGLPEQIPVVPSEQGTWFEAMLDAMALPTVIEVSDVPSQAALLRWVAETYGLVAFGVIPFVCESDRLGAIVISFASLPDRVARLRLEALGAVGPLLLSVEERDQREREVMRRHAEHEEAEAALRQSEEHVRALVRHSKDLFGVVDNHGVLLRPTPNNALDYPDGSLTGSDALDLVHPEDLGAARAALAAAVDRPEQAHRATLRLLHGDGSWRTFDVTATNRLDDPAVRGIVINGHDVTGRRVAEDALRERERHIRALVEHSTDMFAVIDRDGTLLRPTPNRVLDYAEGSLVGGNSLDLVHPDDLEAARATLAHVVTDPSETGRVELRVLHACGSWRTFDVAMTNCLDDPAVGGIVVNGHDVTGRREAEDALRESEQLSRTVLESLSGIVIALDACGTIIKTNQAWMPFIAASGGDPANCDVGANYLALCDGAASGGVPGAAEIVAGVRRVLAGDEEFFRFEYPTVDGRWFVLRVVPLQTTSGGVVVHQIDITDLKRQQQQLVDTSEELRRHAEVDALAATISRELLNAPADTVDSVIVDALGRVAQHLGADTASLAQRDASGWFRRTHNWHDPAVGPLPGEAPARLSSEQVSSLLDALGPDRSGVLNDVVDLPAHTFVRQMLDRIGTQSAGVVAIRSQDDVVGYISLFWRERRAEASAAILSPLRVVGDVLVAADERARAEIARAETDGRLAAVVESSFDAIISTNLDGAIESWNAGAERMYGYATREMIGQSMGLLVPEDKVQEIMDVRDRVLGGEVVEEYETVRLRKDGTPIDVTVTTSAMRDGSGRVVGVSAITHDVTERRRAEDERRRADARFRSLIENATDGIVVLDRDGLVVFASSSVERICGKAPAALIGTHWLDLVEDDAVERARQVSATLSSGAHDIATFEGRVRHADGKGRWVEALLDNRTEDPAVMGIVVNVRDISERKQFEAQLEHHALHDSLTGLPNRALLSDRVEHALSRAHRRGAEVGLLFLDLDRFKQVNDSHGHGVGDQLLVQLAGRLRSAVRPFDTVARFGGDEFVVLVEDAASTEGLLALVERIRTVLQAPFLARLGSETFVTASIGMALSRERCDDPEALLRDADAAMYRAKELGRDRYEMFDPSFHARAVEQLELTNALRRAVPEGELRLHYQPVVAVHERRIVAFEALVRWQPDGDGPFVPPGDFIPVAEDTGLIVEIGTWVLEEACRNAARWRARDGRPPPGIAVNLSVRQLHEPDLVGTVSRVLERTGLPGERLTLEITESMLADDVGEVLATLQELKSIGVRLVVDDFGTGYSSLAYLKRFPVDALKIDQGFVQGLGRDAEDAAIVRAIVGLARGLGVGTVAEGVETQCQLDQLRDLGCDLAQGFLLGRPQPIEAWRADLG